MAKGGRMGGSGKPYQRAIWVFVAACITVAIWGGALHDPIGLLETMKAKSHEIQQTVHVWVAKVGLTEDGTAPKIVGGTDAPVIHGDGGSSTLGKPTFPDGVESPSAPSSPPPAPTSDPAQP